MNETPVFIIDGSSFLYRAYYSIRPLTTKDGTPVNALYGFCRMIRKLLDTHHPSHLLVVWDSKGKTVRHEMYAAYKETRQAAPNDLMQQKELIQQFADIIGLQQLSMQGIEADDLMFSVARQLEQEGCRSVLVTSDKDLGQVVTDLITILDPFKEQFITKQTLEEKMGFPIEKLPFYFALIGDSSDNIPGVAGIGPKGAQTLVQQFTSLSDLYDNLAKVSSERTRLLLEKSRENAFLSEQLFILRFYETYATKDSFAFSEDQWQRAYPFFEKFEFRSLIKDSSTIPQVAEVTLHKTYTFILVDTIEELVKLAYEIKKRGACAIDTETTGLRPGEAELVGISVCVEEGTSHYIPFGHKTIERQLSPAQVLDVLKPVFEDSTIEKYLHHAKFDALMLQYAGIHLSGITFDTMIAASLLVGPGQRIGLKYLSEYYLQEPMVSFSDVVGRGKYKDFSYVPLGLATEYAAADAHQTFRLTRFFEKGLEKEGMQKVFHELEMALMAILMDMERIGIKLDIPLLKSIDQKVTHEIVGIKAQIIDLIGPEHADINLNSPKQLEELLFKHLQLPIIKKTTQKTGYSTDQEVLEQLSKIHPVPALIMKYRELYKIKSTYLETLEEHYNMQTGRIHTTYNQTAVATGRLASSEPNLQNIPVDSFAVRSVFKPEEGSVFLSADYSQIELRVLAYVSQDTTLLSAFKENKDIHALTAAGLFSIDPEMVTSEQRQLGKRINFSILYGLTAHGLSKDLDISHSLAKTYIDKFMAQYPGVVAWMDLVVEKTKEKGYVETLWGRRRHLPGIYERNRTLYDLARRVAINTVAQGTAAEIMKWGMIEINRLLKQHHKDIHMLLQIHDELLFEIPQNELIKVEPLIKSALENVVSWNVPLVVTTRTGKNWQDVTK